MALPPVPEPLTNEEIVKLAESFEDHEVTNAQARRQAKYREKLKD